MLDGLDMLKKFDYRVPPEFTNEFMMISDTFINPFTWLMKKIKGPAYKSPKFENTKALLKDDTDEQNQLPDPTVAASPTIIDTYIVS